jgi:receptor expression-enhancing protein 5/6
MIPSFLARLLEATILLYAGLKSFKAIKSNNKEDDTQWLTFWLLYGIFEFVTTVTDTVGGYIIPFYNEIKIAFLLFIGAGPGALILYPMLEPYLLQAEAHADRYKVEDIVNDAAGKVHGAINGALSSKKE